MRIRILPSAPGAPGGCQYLTSFLVDDVLAIDAGSLGLYGTPDDQARVRDVFLTHSHADHTGSLPVFVENAYEGREDCVVVHGHRTTLTSLRKDVFNDRVWPDFLAFPADAPAFLALSELEPERPVEACGLRVTPVATHHTVPTLGYVLEDARGAAVVIAGDTSATERLWQVARARPGLKAVFLEASFPDELEDFARQTGHLTPRAFAAELDKLGREVESVAVHIKQRSREQTVEQLLGLRRPGLAIGEGGREYVF
jgi:ribonuclease BN (tRNA processing enzyme)